MGNCCSRCFAALMKKTDDEQIILDKDDSQDECDVYGAINGTTKENKSTDQTTYLDDSGFNFIEQCIKAIETRGLDVKGLYREDGVKSKISELISLSLNMKKILNLDEVLTIASAVKRYLSSLQEPLITFELQPDFISAAKKETTTEQLRDIHTLAHKLPQANYEMLDLIVTHLRRVSRNADKNLMNVDNLCVCFGPTLMRSEEKTEAALMNIKFCKIVIQILVENYDMIFKKAPENADYRTTDSSL